MAANSSKKYDIVLFGVTGFTGQLAAEYLVKRESSNRTTGTKKNHIRWAVSARNETKAKTVLQQVGASVDILVADLLLSGTTTDKEEKAKLQAIVEQTKVVLTCSGPFEKYGPPLVELCATHGVYYADITGETDYFRQTIQRHDMQARESGAVILCHCGHDCIPCDLLTYELNEFAKARQCQLQSVMTYQEFAEEAAMSGGTTATAAFQLSKDRKSQTKPAFDPLVTTNTGEKSEFLTKNACPKSTVNVPMLPGRKAGPWIMAPVMMNCIRRSNALLGYSKELSYGDAALQAQTWTAWAKNLTTTAAVGAAIYSPNILGKALQPLIPQSGEGPSREDMEKGFLKLHAIAEMVDEKSSNGETRKLQALFEFRKDTGYLYTAALLCETGIMLVENYGSLQGGCLTPAASLGGKLTERILHELDASLEIKEVEES